MLFQVLCGFEPIFYTTHPNEESFLLKYSNHMSNAEISKILNISEGTIRQRIARGKLIIKEEIERLEGK